MFGLFKKKETEKNGEHKTMMTITPAARENIVTAMEVENRKGAALRVTAQPMSPVSVHYALNFEDPGSMGEKDIVLDEGTFKVVFSEEIKGFVEGAVMDYVYDLQGGGFKITNPNAPAVQASSPNLDTPLAKEIQKVIVEKVNPGIAGHGGFVTLIDVRENTVFLTMGGGCHGCGMSAITLKQGIEGMIKSAVPSITSIVDVTDHAAGSTPYYK